MIEKSNNVKIKQMENVRMDQSFVEITKEIDNNPNINLNNQSNDITKQLFVVMKYFAKQILQLEQLK